MMGEMDVEAVLLTGGASSRMGTDKGALLIQGVPLARRIASSLHAKDIPVTVLGREPLSGFRFLKDADEFQGPLMALSAFVPTSQWCLIFSCDLPLFDSDAVMKLLQLGERRQEEAIIPVVEGRLQPLSGLYRSTSFSKIRDVLDGGKRSMMAWLDRIKVYSVDLKTLGVASDVFKNANTPEELSRLLSQQD